MARTDSSDNQTYSGSVSRSNSELNERLYNVVTGRIEFTIIDIRIILEQKPKTINNLSDAQKLKRDLAFALRITTDVKPSYSSARQGDRLSTDQILISRNMRERLLVNMRHCDLVIESLLESERKRQKAIATAVDSKKTELTLPAYADQDLLAELYDELSKIQSPTGYVYLRRWSMPDKSTWYKLGITNNPERRDSEQNVLPVPAETIMCKDVGSIQRAQLMESNIKRILDSHKIRGAQNRELFHLTEEQVSAIMAAINALD